MTDVATAARGRAERGSYRLRGVVLPDEVERDVFVRDGVVADGPVRDAVTVVDGGWLLPGLVDAHCHVGLGGQGAVGEAEATEQALTARAAGVGLLRDCGGPTDTRPLQERPDLPEMIRAGRHLARPRRYVRGVAVELEDVDQLADAVREQAASGDGWVKLVGDWIDRSVGDLAPLWPDDVLAAAVAAAHDAGARVTAHVFGTDALPGLLAAGIDCIEHGTGLTDDLIDQMARSGTALVPTLVNIARFPAIADAAHRFPAYAAHMRELHAGVGSMVRSAVEAGVPVYAGTDAGGGVGFGAIADEVVALHRAGLSAVDAVGAASWAAREWLGRPGIEAGAPATLTAYRDDPRRDPATLRDPLVVVVRGHLVGA